MILDEGYLKQCKPWYDRPYKVIPFLRNHLADTRKSIGESQMCVQESHLSWQRLLDRD